MQATWKERPYFPARLTDALAGILNSPVTMVSAPPGSGKTTAIRSFVAERQKRGARVLWHTSFGEPLDTCWKQICDLVAEVDAPVAALLYALNFPVRETLSTLAKVIPQLRCPGETILVIDNEHLFMADLPYAYELLNAMAHHGCENFHIVFITQTPRGPHMCPMSTEGVFFLSADPFLFNESDVAEYFMENGVVLTGAELCQVMDSTFGWVSALRLQLLGYRQTGRIEKEAGIERLIHAMLWEPRPVEVKRFLLAFSLMGRVNLRQARELSSCEGMPQNVIGLLDMGGFTQYDQESGFYRLHSLMQEFLSSCFKELPRVEQQSLYICSGRAHLLEGERFSALRMLFLSGNYEELMRVPITNQDMAAFTTNEVLPLLEVILDVCPSRLLYQHPETLLRFAFEAGMRGDARLYTKYRIAAGHALETLKRSGAKERLRGEYTFLYSFSIGNDIARLNAAHLAALKALGGPSTLFDNRYHWTFGVPSVFAQYWSDHAPLVQTLEEMERGMPVYHALARGGSAGTAELMRAEALLNTGRLNDAEAMCHKAMYLASEAASETIFFCADLVLGRIAVLRGDAAAYAASLESIRHRSITAKDKTCHLLADQCLAFLDMLLHSTENVAAWLRDDTEIRNTLYYGGASCGMVLLGKYLLLQKEYNYMQGIADSVIQSVERQHVLLTQVYHHLYLACVGQATGAQEDAHRSLRRALDLALPDEIYLPFAEHAEELAGPLATWCRMNEGSRHAEAIRHLAQLQSTGAARVARRLFSAASKLTPRENEIADYAKRGLSNKQIAEVLFLSPETVKKTMGRVFSKLKVRSRRQLEDLNFS